MHESHGLGFCEMWQGFGSKYSLAIHSPDPIVSGALLRLDFAGSPYRGETRLSSCASVSYGARFWVAYLFEIITCCHLTFRLHVRLNIKCPIPSNVEAECKSSI